MFDPLRAKARLVTFTSVSFLIGIGLASGLGLTEKSHAMPVIQRTPQIPEEAVRPAVTLSEAFVAVAEVVTPSVVRIEARRHPQRTASRGGDPFQLFRNEPREAPLQVAGGSGFIISPDGYILTNNHVVEGAEEIDVFLVDRRAFSARLVGADPFTDVAVIKITDDEEFPALSLGSSDNLSVGEWIVAIGNPGFGGGSTLDYTVTAGIVSAKSRPLGLIGNGLQQEGNALAGFAVEDFIQTDAVINPGNSGGPMLNLRGQVVGINSAIASRTGFYQGYGFAIPIDLAEHVMEDLIQFGKVRRAWLGVTLDPIDALKAESYGLPTVSGVEIPSVVADGPAARAGIRPYDVIVAVDGQEVATQSGLQQNIARRSPDDRITLTVYRDRRPIELSVRLGIANLETEPEVAVSRPVKPARLDTKLGLRIEDMTRGMAAQFGYQDVGGAVITEMAQDGPAARIGRGRLVPGARVVEMDREPVSEAADIRRILEQVEPGDIVSMQVEYPGGNRRIFHIRAAGD